MKGSGAAMPTEWDEAVPSGPAGSLVQPLGLGGRISAALAEAGVCEQLGAARGSGGLVAAGMRMGREGLTLEGRIAPAGLGMLEEGRPLWRKRRDSSTNLGVQDVELELELGEGRRTTDAVDLVRPTKSTDGAEVRPYLGLA